MDSRLVGSWRGRIIDDRFKRGHPWANGRVGNCEALKWMDGWICSGEVSFPLEMTNVGLIGFVLSWT